MNYTSPQKRKSRRVTIRLNEATYDFLIEMPQKTLSEAIRACITLTRSVTEADPLGKRQH